MAPRGPRSDQEEDAPLVFGLHPVLEILEGRPEEVERLFVIRTGGARLGRVQRLARKAGVPVSHVPRNVLGRMVGAGNVHQGVVARVSARGYADVDEMCRQASARDDGLLVLVDRVTDPRNLGSILRTAAAAGAHGVILGGDRTAGLTPVAAKTAAGAAERLPVGREPRPVRRLRDLQEQGFRGVLLDPRGETAWHAVDLRGKCVILAGGEAAGVRTSLVRASDVRAAIPLRGGVESLNVAISVGVLLFEAVRQRGRERA